MARFRTSTHIELFVVLLVVIVLSFFGSLVAADRALASANRSAVTLDAHAAALVAERELRLYAEPLRELFGPLLSAGEARAALGPETPADTVPVEVFDAIWVTDTTGSVVWQIRKPGMTMDPALLRSMAVETRPSGPSPRVRAAASTRDSSSGGVLVSVPLTHRGAFLGAAIGIVPGQRVLLALRDETMDRPRLYMRHAGRTIASSVTDDEVGSLLGAEAPLHLEGDQLEIRVFHRQYGRTLRMVLWLVGLVGVAGLLAILARERRQTDHLAARTADLERLYQEVARSNRMKSEFLANVSHELRTPLNAIVGFVDMLRDHVYGELTPRQALPVDRIAASATHLRHLVDRLLDIAKIAAGRLEVHSEPLVLRPFVLNVASEMESLASERGLSLTIDVAQSLPRIRTDQTHLRQILINLIGNAVKYTHSGGVLVRGRLAGNGVERQPPISDNESGAPLGRPPDPTRHWVALQVSDTGVGIAPGDLERIFDEFEQVNAGARTDSARRGTGLGLAISRRLARLLGGDLSVVSEQGRGSTFTVWLPLDAPESAPV